MFNNKSKPKIKFVSIVPGLSSIDECLPKPANKFLPSWWTKTHTVKSSTSLNSQVIGNVKTCPALPDYFSQGYIVPMWADTIIKYDSKSQIYSWRTSDESFSWQAHTNEQMLQNVPVSFLKEKAYFIFKAICPWRIITPKGYSVYQFPLIYHFNNDITVLPGVIDTDVHHEINQQVLLLKDNKEVFIKRGTPIAQYIPFKRENSIFEIRDASLQDTKLFSDKDRFMTTKFPGSGQYNLMRKQGAV